MKKNSIEKRIKRTRILAKICMAIVVIIMLIGIILNFTSCSTGEYKASDEEKTLEVAKELKDNQPTPTDIEYSLERYNLIRRAYWVNGQREKANALVCQIEKPLGYIVLFQGNTVVSSFVVDGKVSSLNSYLTPDSEYYEKDLGYRSNETTTSRGVDDWSNKWLADVDGSYGENDSGIFFFTPDGKYVEWTGTYLYSDIPFEVDEPVVKYMED